MSQRWLKKFLILGIVTMFFVAGITWFSASQATTTFVYRVTRLTSLGNENATKVYDINDLEQIVGSSMPIGNRMEGQKSILWNSDGTIQANWTNGGLLNSAVSINNRGQVACIAEPGSHAIGRCPYVFENGIRTNIGECGGSSYVSAINEAGQVAGWDLLSAFVWKNGVTTTLRSLDLDNRNAQALGINNKGQIVGYSGISRGTGNSTNDTHAVLWNNLNIQDLGVLPGGKYSKALTINRQGKIVGVSSDRNGISHAVLWENRKIKDLGLLAGNATIATNINERNTVVGYSFVISDYREIPQQAFIWRNGNMRDLNRFLPANSGWELNTARAVNNRGQIVGEGTFNGQKSVYLLTPTWITN